MALLYTDVDVAGEPVGVVQLEGWGRSLGGISRGVMTGGLEPSRVGFESLGGVLCDEGWGICLWKGCGLIKNN